MRGENTAVGFVIIVSVVLFLAFCWWLSRSIGAGFQVTLEAVLHSLAVVATASVVWWFLRVAVIAMLAGLSAALWPIWWKVLDSIALGGGNSSPVVFADASIPWWNTGLFKWGFEIIIIGLLVYALLRVGRD